MSEAFELKLLHVRWNSKNQFAYIGEIAQNPIRLIKHKDNHFTAEIPSYPSFNSSVPCQFAVKCGPKLSQELPKIKLREGSVALFPISDPKYGKWWIEKGSWKGKKGYHDAASCRYAGELTLIIGNITVHINVTPSGFSLPEFQELLTSFKGDLWQLILDNNSPTTTSKEAKGKLPGEEFQKQVSKFIKFADQLLAKPTEELREKQEIQQIERVRPTARTFMELSARGTSVKSVTGRGFEPSYDMPENRYIADIINRLVLIVRNLRNGIQYSKDSLDRNIIFVEQQKTNSHDDFVTIDPAKLEAEIKQEKNKQKIWVKEWSLKKIKFENYFIDFDSNNKDLKYKEKLEFEVRKAEIKEEYPDYIDVSLNVKSSGSYIIKIPSDSCDTDLFIKGAKYQILDVFYEKKSYKNNFNIAILHKISKIKTLVCPYDGVVGALEKEYEKYNELNWKRPLSDKEKEEKRIELLGMQKREDMLSNLACKYEDRIITLNLIYKDLLRLSKKCKSLKITVKNRMNYPGTMIFIQNPSYRGAYSSYKGIQNEAKFDDFLDDLLTIQEFGITDQPEIYERWCLLKIIQVLEDYGFVLENGWESKLVSLIRKGRGSTCSFATTHSILSQKIELLYQPRLESGKTPDFMLKINSKNGESILILDAKNKNYADASKLHNTFSDDLDLLVNKKDYAESGKNAVFILHPKKEKGFLPILPTPQSWSSCTTFGGSSVFDWEGMKSHNPDHMYGGIQVRPENLDYLKMVIAMSLQYLSEDNSNAYNMRPLKNIKFCIVCGGTVFDRRHKCKTKGVHYTCNKCGHFFVEHYCHCGNRLWKHGSYWTYHDTRSAEPYNIKCPSCNGFFFER